MADHAHNTSRRALLASPAAVAVVATPAAAVRPPPETCLALGLKQGRVVKAYQEADWRYLPEAEKDAHFRALQAANLAVMAAPVVTVGDVQAKLMFALEQVNLARDNPEEIEPCDDAAEALRDCLFALQRITGVTLSSLGGDFFDIQIGKAIRRGHA